MRPRDGDDLVWKPNGKTQLTAALNPAFSQVKGVDLVVKLLAGGDLFSRQTAVFHRKPGQPDFSLLLDHTPLVYTRRAGGAADDGNGESGIAGALKLNGSVGRTRCGVLSVRDTGDAGRTFGATRVIHDFGTQSPDSWSPTWSICSGRATPTCSASIIGGSPATVSARSATW